MVEFFKNLFTWFVEHKDEIVVFFTSTNFAAVISSVILLIKQIKATRNTNKSVENSSSILDKAVELAQHVTSVSDKASSTENNTEEIKTKIDSVNKQFVNELEILQQKLNAMLEVQTIVYNSMKDETARKNVFNLLTQAKLVETSKYSELEQQVESLKKKVEEKVNDVQSVVEETVTTVQNVVGTKKKKSDAARY